MNSNWIKTGLLAVTLTGVIMDSISSFAGSGRGDFHTSYQGQSVDDLIIEYMEANKIPGMLLAIVQAPYITRVVGYGLGDTSTKRLVATNTVFNIGQLTTAYTAVAIMQLKEAGKLKLDDSVSRYLTDIPEHWNSITIRDLITHSSGIADYTDSTDFNYSRNYNSDEILDLVRDKELLFKSGTQMHVSATNPYILGLIIEKASGMSYQDFITKNQIKRIGLKHTFFISNIESNSMEVNNGDKAFKHSKFLQNPVYINPVEPAKGYDHVDNKLVVTPAASWGATFSSSGIIASAEDISLWDMGLAGDILVKDPEDRKFLYSAVNLDGKTVPGNAGWFFPGHKGLMEIKGNIPGYSAFLSRFTAPAELLCVTLLANKGYLPDMDILARKIAASFDAKLGTPQGASWSETLQSPYSVKETIERAMTLIKKNGGTVFARVDHSGEAHQVNQKLLDTEVIIIGNPAKGTVLMQTNAAMALDLPLRIMATEDSSGQVWLSFTDPVKLAKEYHVSPEQVPVLNQIGMGIRKVCETAVSPQSQLQ